MADADRFPWQVNPRGKAANFAPSSQIRQEIGFGQREKQRMLSAALGEDGSIEVQSEYHSARVRAFVDQGGALTSRGAFGDGVGEELDYTVVRSTGLPLGYNLFTTPPVPPLRSEGPAPLLPSSASWYVDVKTLEAGDAAAQLTGLPGKQRAKRQRDAQLVMRHNPTTLLVSEVKALNEAASRLAKLDKSVAESSTNVSTVKDALASDAPKALETAVAVGNKAREAVALHKKSSAEVMQQVTHLDTTWRGLQEEGQKARKGALGRMSEIKDALQSELEEIELRLTDHVTTPRGLKPSVASASSLLARSSSYVRASLLRVDRCSSGRPRRRSACCVTRGPTATSYAQRTTSSKCSVSGSGCSGPCSCRLHARPLPHPTRTKAAWPRPRRGWRPRWQARRRSKS